MITAALAGGYHHRPEKSPATNQPLSRAVALADKLSAGERADAAALQKHPSQQMLTIFDRVALPNSAFTPREKNYLPLAPLALNDKVIFPNNALGVETTRAACHEIRAALQLAIFLAFSLSFTPSPAKARPARCAGGPFICNS
jgi:hypothetical protein